VAHKKKAFPSLRPAYKKAQGEKKMVYYKEGKLYTITHIMLEKVQN
jgi:hypothetical protein